MKLTYYIITLALLLIPFLGESQCAVPQPPTAPDPFCYNQTILNDSWCCNNSWDGICQGAYDGCAPAGCPVPQPATAPDNACYNQVITNDAFCCNTMWDAFCQASYDACAPAGGPCSSITSIIGCGTSNTSSMSGTGDWNNFTCGFSTPGVESIWAFTATTTGLHSIDITAVSGGFVDFMWVNSTAGCSAGAGWNCIDDIAVPGNYGSMNWVAGQTYYILIDPETTSATSVTFDLSCPNGPVTASDCALAIPICTNLAFQVDPNGFGNVDELCTYCTSNPGTNPASANTGCLNQGELNSTWLQVNVQTGGTLEFSFGSAGANTNCYDWIMWPYNASTCAGIASNTLAPQRCNWNFPCAGFTGVAAALPGGGNAGNFEPVVNAVTGSQYIICFSNYSSALTSVPLNFFGTADISCTPLPVEMVEFTGEHFGAYNGLKWYTGAEVNSSHFEIEKSTDGGLYDKIGVVMAAGNSNNMIEYSFDDHDLRDGMSYYRIKQVDNNGAAKYSKVIALNNEHTSGFEVIRYFPNPTNDELHVQLFSSYNEVVSYSVMEMNGTKVSESIQEVTAGLNQMNLSVNQLSKGVYMLQIRGNYSQKSQQIRFVVN
jgi:hypothetical protein